MHGMFDHHTRIDFARERAETLRDVMRASRRGRQTRDENAGRHAPTRNEVATRPAPRLVRTAALVGIAAPDPRQQRGERLQLVLVEVPGEEAVDVGEVRVCGGA